MIQCKWIQTNTTKFECIEMTKIEATGENYIDAKESKDKWAVQLKKSSSCQYAKPD